MAGSGLIGISILSRLCIDGAIFINADLNGVTSGNEIVKQCDVTNDTSVDQLINSLKNFLTSKSQYKSYLK